MKILVVAVAAILVAPALAADLPTKKGPPVPPAPPAPLDPWTGFFAGGYLGWCANNHFVEPLTLYHADVGYFDQTSNTWCGGGQIGYRYLTPWRFVIGAEATVGWSPGDTIRYASHASEDFGAVYTDHTSGATNWDLLGILGWPIGNFMPYLVGGWSWADFTETRTQILGVTDDAVPGNSETLGPMRQGWALGAGLSYRFWDHWEIFGQYLHTNYINVNLVYPIPERVFRSQLYPNAVTVGVNYKF
jgi:outer membrane immunogenic protein